MRDNNNNTRVVSCIELQNLLFNKVDKFLKNNREWDKVYKSAYNYPENLYKSGKINFYDYNALISNIDNAVNVFFASMASIIDNIKFKN